MISYSGRVESGFVFTSCIESWSWCYCTFVLQVLVVGVPPPPPPTHTLHTHAVVGGGIGERGGKDNLLT